MKTSKTSLKVDKTSTIPLGGTLGILAHGYQGILMWRQVRHEAEQKRIAQLPKANQRNEEN